MSLYSCSNKTDISFPMQFSCHRQVSLTMTIFLCQTFSLFLNVDHINNILAGGSIPVFRWFVNTCILISYYSYSKTTVNGSEVSGLVQRSVQKATCAIITVATYLKIKNETFICTMTNTHLTMEAEPTTETGFSGVPRTLDNIQQYWLHHCQRPLENNEYFALECLKIDICSVRSRVTFPVLDITLTMMLSFEEQFRYTINWLCKLRMYLYTFRTI